jgi:transcription initiation factor TFIID subunit 5
MLKQEAQLTADQIQEASPDFLLLLDHEIKSPSAYEASYKSVRSWIESSLDIYKVQLSQILYPLFIHVYLSLVEGNYTEQAKSFMEQFKSDHIDLRRQELLKLSAILNREQMRENEFAQALRQNKTVIEMTSYTFELLLSFLQEKRYVFLLKILNEHIRIKGIEWLFIPTLTWIVAGKDTEEEEEAAGVDTKSQLKLGRLPLDSWLTAEVERTLNDQASPSLPIIIADSSE